MLNGAAILFHHARYDVENRIIGSGSITPPPVQYAYAPDNKRVWRGMRDLRG
jgi:hypothetical protein